tara:strand:- start:3134 stop:3700 length:567 start_codon:yes stop_codon:yes gene_type:complete
MKIIINFFIRGKISFFEMLMGQIWTVLIKLSGGECGKNLRVGRGVKFKYGPSEKIIFGDNVYIGDFVIIDCNHDSKLYMGSNSYLSVGVFIASNKSISIGSSTLIAEYTSIRDHDHGTQLDIEVFKQENVSFPIHIGEDVWIGRGCVILKGVTIENKCIIGANSVVNKNLYYGDVAVGSPAKKIKSRV